MRIPCRNCRQTTVRASWTVWNPSQGQKIAVAAWSVIFLLLGTFAESRGRDYNYWDGPDEENQFSGSASDGDYPYTILGTAIPKGLSDMSATVQVSGIGRNLTEAVVFLAGGCDNPAGNEYDPNLGAFVCNSVSQSLYRVTLETGRTPTTVDIEQLADLPFPRYRHAGVGTFLAASEDSSGGGRDIAVGRSYVWLVGGRDAAGNMVTSVDVYDVLSDEWLSFNDLPAEYVTSGLVGFAAPSGAGGVDDLDTVDMACFAGGYTEFYDRFSNSVFCIDTVKSLETGVLEIVDRSPLLYGRGDLMVSTYYTSTGATPNTFVIVSGGFDEEYSFCRPSNRVERYDMSTDTWTELAPLLTPRSGGVSVYGFEGSEASFRVLLGETVPANICDVEIPPENQIEAVTDQEKYDLNVNQWSEEFATVPLHRFRTPGVVINGDASSIYTFGGELGYEATCNCFPVSSEIIVYHPTSPVAGSTGLPTASPVAGSTGSPTQPTAPLPTSIPTSSPTNSKTIQPSTLLPTSAPSTAAPAPTQTPLVGSPDNVTTTTTGGGTSTSTTGRPTSGPTSSSASSMSLYSVWMYTTCLAFVIVSLSMVDFELR